MGVVDVVVRAPKMAAAVAGRGLSSDEEDVEEADVDTAVASDGNDAVRRTRCQKVCCDFRVTTRSRLERAEFCCFRCSLAALVGIFIFIVIMLCGSRYENLQAERAPSTTGNFVTNVTCA